MAGLASAGAVALLAWFTLVQAGSGASSPGAVLIGAGSLAWALMVCCACCGPLPAGRHSDRAVSLLLGTSTVSMMAIVAGAATLLLA